MSDWRLNVLGGFELLHGGKPVELQNRKDRLLLAYLALNAEKPQLRDKLASLLWADRGEEQARGSLRQALAALRAAFGDDASGILEASRDEVVLRLEKLIVDAAAFGRAVQSEMSAEAIAFYGGPLLDAIEPPSAEFEEWLRPERQRLEDTAARWVERYSFGGHSTGSPAPTIQFCRQLLARDRLREPVYRALMRLVTQAGDRAEALKVYAQCKAALAEELGIGPAAETEALYLDLVVAPAQTIAMSTSNVAPVTANARPAIAVLPFTNLGRDETLGVLCEGLAEDITLGLGRFRLLFVIDRHSSAEIARTTADTREIRRQLGVDLVVQGSLQRVGEQIRVMVKLTEAETRQLRWSGQYVTTEKDVLDTPDRIVAGILPNLSTQIENTLLDRAKRKPSLEAYELLLRGIKHLRGYAPGDNEKGAECFDKALQADPDFALAMGYRAFADVLINDYENAAPGVLVAAARRIEHALALDPEEPRLHWLLGLALGYLKDFYGEHRCNLRAHELNPGDANTLATLGMTTASLGDPDAGIAMIREAMRLNPFHPEWYWLDLGSVLYMAGRFDEAAEAYRQKRSPQAWLWSRLAASYAMAGRMEEARAAAAEVLKIKPDFAVRDHRTGGWPENEVEKFKDGMRLAGLPE